MSDTEALDDIFALLRRRIGLAHETVGTTAVVTAISGRVKASGLGTYGEYLRKLQRDESEFRELVEQIVVNETWFFRDTTPFRCVRHFARQWRQRREPGTKFRVLSVPCSTGEEPYSIGMTLLGDGLGQHEIEIEAVDLSARALQRAAEAVYSANSFRPTGDDFAAIHEPFFVPVGARRQVRDDVRQCVRFRQENLAQAGFLVDCPGFDVIFCRNLLIYFDDDARRTALQNLQRLLHPRGMLYVGHVEGSVMTNHFDAYHTEFPFAFIRRDGMSERLPPAPPLPRVVAPRKKHPTHASLVAVGRPPTPLVPAVPIAAPSPAQPSFAERIEAARDAANQGRLAQAASDCEQLLQEKMLSAEVHCLLGVVRQATGNLDEAERQFNKALYLDPRHRESLTHLLLLAVRRGDVRGAENFRRRLQTVAAG